jgi:hypothetical protein
MFYNIGPRSTSSLRYLSGFMRGWPNTNSSSLLWKAPIQLGHKLMDDWWLKLYLKRRSHLRLCGWVTIAADSDLKRYEEKNFSRDFFWPVLLIYFLFIFWHNPILSCYHLSSCHVMTSTTLMIYLTLELSFIKKVGAFSTMLTISLTIELSYLHSWNDSGYQR